MTLPRDRFVLKAHEPQTRPGPGRKQQLISMESFGSHQLADLLMRVETLLGHGYHLTINAPTAPPTVEAATAPDPRDCTLTVVAS